MERVLTKGEIARRKESAVQEIKKNYPQFVERRSHIDSGIFSTVHTRDVPDIGIEFVLWEELERERYWRVLPPLNELKHRGKLAKFDEVVQRDIVELMVEQAMEGKSITSSIPLYSDIWAKVGNPEENPLAHFVTKENKHRALNVGFWDCLYKVTDARKSKDAGKQFVEIFYYPGFFFNFDYLEGSRRAPDLPDIDEIPSFGMWKDYTGWLIVQQDAIRQTLPREDAISALGKLSAPLAYGLLKIGDYDRDAGLKKLFNEFIPKEVLHTKPMQRVLGIAFEDELKNLFLVENGYYLSTENLKRTEELLDDAPDRVEKVWNKVRGGIDLGGISPIARKYIPASEYKTRVDSLTAEMEKMERFDIELFNKWMQPEIQRAVSPSTFGRVRNSALENYVCQERRPKIETAKQLFRMRERFGEPIGDEVCAAIFADFLSKKNYPDANNLLHYYGIPFGRSEL